MRKTLAIVAAKITKSILQVFGSPGSAMPGLVAERIAPSILKEFSGSFSKGIVMVTGTNGKTTTTKIIAQALRHSGYSVLTNGTGSNFTRGVISSMTSKSSLGGKLEYDYAIIESDEAYSRYIASALQPDVLLVTNVMRDQLDRYGEIDHTANLILEAAEIATTVVLNADDPPVAAIGDRLDSEVRTLYFGVTNELRSELPSDAELLGGDEVSRRRKHKVDVEVTDVASGEVIISVQGKEKKIPNKFEGMHNAVNIASAYAVITCLSEVDESKVISGISTVRPAFGRGESISIEGRKIHVALAKNPGGFNQNVRTFISENTKVVLILINDNYADSRDVSWLWDVNFDAMKEIDATVILGGSRAFDMALRLQYSGVSVDEIDQDIATAFEHALSAGDSIDDVVVFPTYTAMLELRKIMMAYNKEIGALS